MLLSEGAHDTGLVLFNTEIHAMNKGTFYLIRIGMAIVEMAQSRFTKRLLALKQPML